ncbi:unnamed protein product [Staurois parvus]|uniref:Leprecan-like alpha-helical domain-containing protein n=1 Tax=Staurois parvus TaxID=386267 RepID=A0ABN9DSV4_9NEOB|nr:unnamed protein product [Staurois parvus]
MQPKNMRFPLILLPLALAQSLSLPPPDELLMDGVALFSRGDWSGARDRLWGALRSLREVRGARLRCGEECGPRGAHLEELVLERADCLLSCERLQLGQPSLYRLTQETEKIFLRGAPYNYLQLAHYKLEELDEAAAAAFTFFTRNPHHEQIQDDLQRYRKMKGVQQQSLRDLEEPPYRTLFSQAKSLLSQGKLASAVLKLEESLSACLSALRECRTLCEGTREKENQTHQEISEVIADYYTQVLQCKQRCILDLTLVPGRKRPKQDSIVSHLQLLEDTYSQLGEWESATEIAKSLLLFHPHKESIMKKLQRYNNKLGEKTGGKTTREHCVIRASVIGREEAIVLCHGKPGHPVSRSGSMDAGRYCPRESTGQSQGRESSSGGGWRRSAL